MKTAMGIVLSGMPCTGKSTWITQFIAKSKLRGMTVSVISSDAVSYKICDDYNKNAAPSEKLTYATVWNNHRAKIEAAYQAAIEKSKSEGVNVLILDRTHTTVDARAKALKLAQGIPNIYLLSMQVFNEQAWDEKLQKRNLEEQDKTITPEIIQLLKKGASVPVQAEGFNSIVTCKAIGEPGWEEAFQASIDQMIEAFISSKPQ